MKYRKRFVVESTQRISNDATYATRFRQQVEVFYGARKANLPTTLLEVTVTSEVAVTSDEKKKRTLTNLYNARPTWLDLAYKRLDEAVFAAYGWKSDLNDEEILEKLLALLPSLRFGSASLNLERAKG